MFPPVLSVVVPDTRFNIPSDHSGVHDDPPPEDLLSGLPKPIQHRLDQIFQSFSFIGQKGLEMFGIQRNVEFSHRFFQVEIRFVSATTILRKVNGFFNLRKRNNKS